MSDKTKQDTEKPLVAVFGAAGHTGRFVKGSVLNIDTIGFSASRLRFEFGTKTALPTAPKTKAIG